MCRQSHAETQGSVAQLETSPQQTSNAKQSFKKQLWGALKHHNLQMGVAICMLFGEKVRLVKFPPPR